MKKTNQKLKQAIIILLIPSVVIIMFFIISISNTKQETSAPSSTPATVTQPKTETQTPETQTTPEDIQPTSSYTSLTIDPDRCRGCGRCVAIDPEHFEMSGNVAQVISETNLDSQSLSSAISACPADVINLS